MFQKTECFSIDLKIFFLFWLARYFNQNKLDPGCSAPTLILRAMLGRYQYLSHLHDYGILL